MAWIKSDFRFGDRGAVLYVTSKEVFCNIASALLTINETDPDRMEQVALDTILRYRPELAGCVIHNMGFNLMWARWEFLVSHGSLPRIERLQAVPAMPLVKEPEPAAETFEGDRMMEFFKQ
jgi:hypothetical protein